MEQAGSHDQEREPRALNRRRHSIPNPHLAPRLPEEPLGGDECR